MIENKHYQLVEKALRWIAVNQSEQPDLTALAEEIGVSPYHLQKTFQAWAGITPKQFLKSLTRESAIERLHAGESVLDAAISSGLSGPGRLHDLMVSTEALSPGEVRARGKGVELGYGLGESHFGPAVVAWSPRGISFLGFCADKSPEQVILDLRSQWKNAVFSRDENQAQKWLDRIFEGTSDEPLPIWLRGSPFQLKVWEALLAIPEGTNVTYGDIAKMIEKPAASQAVGGAVGSNPVSWIIPCHRVIRQLGGIGGYRWGLTTKRAMIGLEAARSNSARFTLAQQTRQAIAAAQANTP